jgi:hypothetical protein
MAVILCWMLAVPTTAVLCQEPRESGTQRFGVGVARAYGDITEYPIEQLHIGWYSDWGRRRDPPGLDGIEYAQLIRVSEAAYPPNWSAIRHTLEANPGSLWIVGNEPECISQDNRTPSEYAAIYHECYTFIKEYDPSAMVAIGGVVQPTPLRLEWLDLVLDTYRDYYGCRMPVDVWNTHVQILQEKRGDWGCGIPAGLNDNEGEIYSVTDNADPQIFIQLIRDFRQWMTDRGERDWPLIISEFGVLMPSEYLGYGNRAEGDMVVMQFMSEVFDFLLTSVDQQVGYPQDGYRLVQRWLWYSLNEPYYDFVTQTGMNGALFESDDPGQLTTLGRHWVEYMNGLLGKAYALYVPLHFNPFTYASP